MLDEDDIETAIPTSQDRVGEEFYLPLFLIIVTICTSPLTSVCFPSISEKVAALNCSERVYLPLLSPLCHSVYTYTYVYIYFSLIYQNRNKTHSPLQPQCSHPLQAYSRLQSE